MIGGSVNENRNTYNNIYMYMSYMTVIVANGREIKTFRD